MVTLDEIAKKLQWLFMNNGSIGEMETWVTEILAEYDRLTALNAQLLKAAKAVIDPENSDEQGVFCWVIDDLETAIRAAEDG